MLTQKLPSPLHKNKNYIICTGTMEIGKSTTIHLAEVVDDRRAGPVVNEDPPLNPDRRQRFLMSTLKVFTSSLTPPQNTGNVCR
jgi:hypothetical protein